MRRLERALLSLLGIGFLPSPGTLASLVTAAVLLLLHGTATGLASLGVWAALGFGAAATLLLAGREARRAGDSDPGFVVTDEVAGQALALGLAGAVSDGHGGVAAVLAFALFRALDIWKPGPVGAAERLPGALGVLADDVVAGALAGGLVAGARALGALG